MLPYQSINYELEQILCEQGLNWQLFWFSDHVRWNNNNMIRRSSDFGQKYYYHTQAQEWRARQDAVRPQPFGCLNHSFEPLQYNLDRQLWEENHHCIDVVLHSQAGGTELEHLRHMGIKPVHWFAHAYLCSEYYFKHYAKLDIVRNWQARPILSPWLFANRLNRQHRTQFLETVDLVGEYSLLRVDPQGVEYTGPIEPRSFDDHSNSSAELSVTDLTPWNTSFLHVVGETVWQDTVHFTEKIFKPMVFHQPFVVLQAPYSLEYLRSYGFKTFDNWWDESYDTIEDPNERMAAVADIVNWIPSQNLEKLRMEMAGVLEHNYRHFYENIPAICLQELRTLLH